MKNTVKGAAAVALLSAMMITPALAQTDTSADANRDARGDVIGDPEDDGFDHWGLLGLLGLAGLLKRPKENVVVRHDTNTTNPPR